MKLNLSNSKLSKETFIQFLNNIAIHKTDTYFYITPDSYKKANYNNSLDTFILDISSCYPKSKQYFINRPFNYKRLCTVIRQLSNYFSFTYVSELKYDHSTYSISYKIYTTSEGTP
jgi:hypothetical protein